MAKMRVVLAGLVALAAVGCGRGDDAEVTTVREIDLLQAVEAAGTARLALETSWAAGADEAAGLGTGWAVEATGEGVVDFASGTSEVSTTVTVASDWPADAVDQPLARPAMRSEERTVDGRSYVRSWLDGDEPGPWTTGPGGHGGEGLESLVSSVDPTEVLDRLREVADRVTEVGPDEVRGDATTRYEVVLAPDDLGEDAGPWLPEDVDEVTVDVWVDDEDRLRRVALDDHLTIELWDFGLPVEVEVPSAVTDDLDGAFGDVFPTVTGDWAAVTSGTVDDVAWTVFAAPAEVDGTTTTCRTLEVEGGATVPGLDGMLEALPTPNHEGRLATCGSGLVALAGSTFVAEPSVQVLTTLFDGADITAVVVSARYGAAALETADGTLTPLDLDAAGVAVVAREATDGTVAVVLDGEVRCPVPGFGPVGVAEDDLLTLGGMVGLAPCVRP